MMTRIGLALSVFLILGVATVYAGMTLSDAERGPQDANWERIQHTGLIRVGIDPSIPPFAAFGDPLPVGFEPALAQALADELGIEVHFVTLGFDGLYDALVLGEADVVIAALRPDPLRLDRVRYTQAYFDGGHILVSRDGASDWEALAGKTLAVEFASEGDIAARQAEVQIVRFLTVAEAIDAVQAGEADAALVERVAALDYRALNPDTALIFGEQPLVSDPYVMAVRRHDWRLHRNLKNALTDLIANGTVEMLQTQWIGVQSP